MRTIDQEELLKWLCERMKKLREAEDVLGRLFWSGALSTYEAVYQHVITMCDESECDEADRV